MTELTGRDRLKVERDGEEVEVFNHVTVPQEHYVNSVNGHETFHGPIKAGDGGIGQPDAITERVTKVLHDEFHIGEATLEEQDIEVIDINAVDVL